ncbi:MAG: cytochrome c biogenesis protein CcsA [Acidobacteria bacterium]|nr:cytochrome c biogenesis protein CcsA [Acidobacteriota bacterium]
MRRWTMVSWLFLSFGLTLGMIWAYEELGWGGYWEWDPVENAGLLPWFTATAFLHSVMVQERRGMLRVWNVTLVIISFFLTIVGTFLTRSGVVQSVHAFGEDPQLARLFTVFMVTILTVSFGFVFYRLPLLKARNELDSWASREAAFMANNWVLLFGAVFVLFGTMFPTLSEAVTGERLTVGAPFFNKWMLPIGLALLLLTGIGPLLAWRKSTLVNMRDQFMWPILTAVVVGAAVVAVGVRVWSSGLCFALSGFVVGTVAQEFIRGARVRQGTTGTDVLTAMIGLVSRNKRRYGGYIVHLGIVAMFLGFAGEGFKRDEQVLLKPGQQTTVGRYTIRHDAVRVTDDGQKQMITGHVVVFEKDREIARMYPAKWFYRKHEDQPTTEVAIRRTMAEDLYIVMPAFNLQDQSAQFQIVVNPLVDWIWAGFGIMALGTGIALLPERVLSFAMARATQAVATASLVLISTLLSTTAVSAQHSGSAQMVPVVPRNSVERELQRAIICMCGTCGRQLVRDCACAQAAQMREEIAHLVNDRGMNKDQVIQYYIAKYGSQEPLAAPLDRGFNRLAWLLPYLVGGGAAISVGFVAVRWSRGQAAANESTPSLDREVESRLDDELRDLD